MRQKECFQESKESQPSDRDEKLEFLLPKTANWRLSPEKAQEEPSPDGQLTKGYVPRGRPTLSHIDRKIQTLQVHKASCFALY